MKPKLIASGLIKMISGIALMGLLLFWPAGTMFFAGAWRILILLFVPMLVVGIVLLAKSPDLLAKRLRSKEQQSEQKAVVALSSLLFVACFLLCGFDFRFGWTQLPAWLSVVGSVLFVASYGIYAEVMRENAYLSRTVEIQENQKVIDTGLYGIVRHPMYMGVTLLFVSMPVAIGSGVGVIPMLFIPFLLVKRIKNEEKLLENELDGYIEYEKKTKYRLIPFIW